MRQCGDCQLCCTLLAVREIGKLAGQKCEHQKFKKGCMVYGSQAMPPSCKQWNCLWLLNDDTADLSRPDRSHYVIDVMLDYVEASNEETGEEFRVPVVQVWVDPKYPDAHRDPVLRDFLARRGEQGIAAIIRYDAKRAFVLSPPSMSGTDDFVVIPGKSSGRDHTAAEIIDTLGRLSS